MQSSQSRSAKSPISYIISQLPCHALEWAIALQEQLSPVSKRPEAALLQAFDERQWKDEALLKDFYNRLNETMKASKSQHLAKENLLDVTLTKLLHIPLEVSPIPLSVQALDSRRLGSGKVEFNVQHERLRIGKDPVPKSVNPLSRVVGQVWVAIEEILKAQQTNPNPGAITLTLGVSVSQLLPGLRY
ncbi:hypothetical protein SRHO_G00016550 [Serrasalmus rhombeus]